MKRFGFKVTKEDVKPARKETKKVYWAGFETKEAYWASFDAELAADYASRPPIPPIKRVILTEAEKEERIRKANGRPVFLGFTAITEKERTAKEVKESLNRLFETEDENETKEERMARFAAKRRKEHFEKYGEEYLED